MHHTGRWLGQVTRVLTALAGDYLYVVGGLDESKLATSKVFRARLTPDTLPLPEGRHAWEQVLPSALPSAWGQLLLSGFWTSPPPLCSLGAASLCSLPFHRERERERRKERKSRFSPTAHARDL